LIYLYHPNFFLRPLSRSALPRTFFPPQTPFGGQHHVAYRQIIRSLVSRFRDRAGEFDHTGFQTDPPDASCTKRFVGPVFCSKSPQAVFSFARPDAKGLDHSGPAAAVDGLDPQQSFFGSAPSFIFSPAPVSMPLPLATSSPCDFTCPRPRTLRL